MSTPSLSPFKKAVAGSTPFLFAQDFPGKVFKPVHVREKSFYESIAKESTLKKLVPKYFGTLSLNPSAEAKLNDDLRDTPSEYLVLEDLTYEFTHPCILDVKLGTTHHDIDLNDPTPAPVRKSKYITATDLGFCLTGMQVFKAPQSKFEYMDKAEGRDLTETTVVDKLGYFFHDGQKIREDVIILLLERLKQVCHYFENHPTYMFRSTSLLLIYEGGPGATRVDARMIDFAHANHITEDEFKDVYGYLFGTNNLKKILEGLVHK